MVNNVLLVIQIIINIYFLVCSHTIFFSQYNDVFVYFFKLLVYIKNNNKFVSK